MLPTLKTIISSAKWTIFSTKYLYGHQIIHEKSSFFSTIFNAPFKIFLRRLHVLQFHFWRNWKMVVFTLKEMWEDKFWKGRFSIKKVGKRQFLRKIFFRYIHFLALQNFNFRPYFRTTIWPLLDISIWPFSLQIVF